MQTLKNKLYKDFDYFSRYNTVPYFYDTLNNKEIYGIGTNIFKDGIDYVSHKVSPTDNLDYLALKYYNNPTYWWAIAYFNDIQDAFVSLYPMFSTIKIPALAGITFGNER